MSRPKTEAAAYGGVYVRLPNPLLATIKAQASEARRPINTQVIMLLEKALKEQHEDGVEYERQQAKARIS